MPIGLITGGSRGLGKSSALKMAEAQIDILLTYHSRKSDADEVVNAVRKVGRKAVALQLDVEAVSTFPAFAETVRSALKSHWNTDRFDFLVNNAGFGVYAPFAETTEAQFDSLVNAHFKGVFFLTQKLLPLISDGGRILNVSSGLTRFSYPGYSAYASMKGAIEVLTRFLAKELASRRITENTIAPGAIETDFGGGAVRDDKKLNAYIASQTALGRVGVVEDIGGLVASLCHENTRWVNGQRIEASGGIYL